MAYKSDHLGRDSIINLGMATTAQKPLSGSRARGKMAETLELTGYNGFRMVVEVDDQFVPTQIEIIDSQKPHRRLKIHLGREDSKALGEFLLKQFTKEPESDPTRQYQCGKCDWTGRLEALDDDSWCPKCGSGSVVAAKEKESGEGEK